MSEKKERLKEYLLANCERLAYDGARVVISRPLPVFDLYPRDYLAFAEEELSCQSERSLINCVGHLKRAIDCQLELFLDVFNLRECFRKKGYRFGQKLDFIGHVGILNSRALSRLNKIRNSMEHEFRLPQIADLEAYFDLACAFISVLERVTADGSDRSTEYVVRVVGDEDKGVDGRVESYFEIGYDPESETGPTINVEWSLVTAEPPVEVKLSADPSDMEDFEYFFRVLNLLGISDAFASDKYILSQLAN